MKKEIHIIEETLHFGEMDKEDGGQFNGFTVNNAPAEDNGMFVKLCSWDDNMEHTELNKFVGRKVRITIETID